MSRNICRQTIQDRYGNAQRGATVHVYDPGTTNAITPTMYDAYTGGNVLSNPLTTDANGEVLFYLDSALTVDLNVVVASVSRTIAGVQIGDSTLGGVYARTIASGHIDVAGIPTMSVVYINGEGNADDNLDYIDNGVDGQILFLSIGSQENAISLRQHSSPGNLYGNDDGRGTTERGVLKTDFVWAIAMYHASLGEWDWDAFSLTANAGTILSKISNAILAGNAREVIIPTLMGAIGSTSKALPASGTNGLVGLLAMPDGLGFSAAQVATGFKLSYEIMSAVGGAAGAATIKVSIYSDLGVLQETVTDTIDQTTTGIRTLSFATGLRGKNYYVAIFITANTMGGVPSIRTWSLVSAAFNTISSQPRLSGSVALSAGAPPSSFDPTSAITAATDSAPVVRIDTP